MSTSSVPFLALSCIGALASTPAMALAAKPVEANAAEPQSRIDIIVNGQRKHGEAVESPKATAPLQDTPQTITVVNEQTLRKQNLQTLRDALQVVPGITFGAGEGGGGYGDAINLRGYSANNDITVDGVRDSAQYSRTDPFNLQQIEVYNGANSVFNGSGSVGGTINLVSKVPGPVTATTAQAAVGTDDYYRAAIDSNVRVSPLVAVRLNAVYHRNDVPGRDVETYKRWGVAPSITIGVDGPTSLTLAYVHQRDDNTPIYGVPYFRNQLNDGPLPGVDDSDYFGIANLDHQRATVDRATATFRHEISEALAVRNLTRWQRVGQISHTSAPQGTFCLANGLQPVSTTANGGAAACPATLTPGQYAPSGPRGLVRDQENQLLVNQTDLTLVTGSKGGLRNTMVVGASYSVEDYGITTASLLRDASGTALAQPPIDLFAPDTNWTGPIHYTITAQSTATTKNAAVYAFDTVEFGRHFEINGGVRWEYNDATFRGLPLVFVPPGTTQASTVPQISRDKLLSYRVGAVFKPVEAVSLYAAYGNAKTPSSATVRLGCGTVSAPGAADPCASAPETAKNYEVGAKATLGRLALTAAAFRNERSNYRVPSNDPSQPAGLQVLDGKSRVDGIALGLSGNVTRAWTIFANYTYLDGTVRQSISDFARSQGTADPQAGSRLIQTPEHSGSLFTTYKLPFGLELGYGLTYQGSFALNTPVAANPVQYRSDDYLIHRAYVGYNFGHGLSAQINVQNLTDARYFTGIRNNINATTGAISGGWATPGEGRSGVLSLFYGF